MLYNISFDIAAVVLTLGLLLVYSMRRNYPTTESRVFRVLAVANLVACVADIASACAISYARDVPVALNYVFAIAYHCATIVVAIGFFHYVLVVSGKMERLRKQCAVASALAVMTILFTALSPVTHLVFSFDADGAYVHGPLFPVLYLVGFALILLSAACLIASHDELNAYQIVPPLVACITAGASSVVESLFPELLLQGFAVSVMLTLLYEGTEASSKFMFSGSYCYNYRAFRDQVDRRIKRGETFSIVGLGFNNISSLSALMDFNAFQALTINVGEALRRRFGQRDTFCLRNGFFAVICSIAEENATVLKAGEVLEGVDLPHGCVVDLDARFAVLRHPGIVNSGREADDVMVSAFESCTNNASDRVSYVDGAALTAKRREAQVTVALRDAVANRRFEMRYQPVRNVQTGRFDSAEALVRLTDPALGFISPDEFIPIAESNGMIMEISDQIMEQVCCFFDESKLDEMGVTRMDINLSAVQCAKRTTADELLYMFKKHGIDPSLICMEVTETAVLNDAETTDANLEKLHNAGVKLALDDYGTGYCAATNLFELPIDVVKIDKSLVWSAMEDDNALAVLKNVTGMCHSLGKQIVAEGVETAAMVRVLEMLGVEHLQGFLYAKPLTQGEYLAFLAEQQECACRPDHWCQSRFCKLDAGLTLEELGARS